MLSKKTQAILACLLIVASFVFVYSVYAVTKEDKDPEEKGPNTCIQVKAKLTRDTGGVKARADGNTYCDNSYGSIYLYATVARQKPDSNQGSYYGKVSRKAEIKVGANSRNNQASAVGHDYYNNQHVSALVRGRI